MDMSPNPSPRDTPPRLRPEGCGAVALVLQGGGALGAYQAGVYQALQEAGLEPDWLAGVSIGGINAALIAGNPPELRVPRLRAFWETVTARPMLLPLPDGDVLRKAYNALSSFATLSLGQPGFFAPRPRSPWLAPRGADSATSYYDSTPLRDTLLRLVDVGRLNSGEIRFAVGAVNVATGNFSYFDNGLGAIEIEHVLASAALPPALPMVQVGSDWFWDGGVVSNTPLQHLLDNIGSRSALVFQVDLFSARGPVPRDMADVLSRQKDIQYSSRTRLVTDTYRRLHRANVRLRRLLGKLPDSALDAEERELKRQLQDLPGVAILQLIYRQSAWEGQMRDYEFSAASMREHWDAGYRDTRQTLLRRSWLRMPAPDEGIVVHDVHQAEP